MSSSFDGIAQFLTVLIIFLFVLSIVYFTTVFIGKTAKMQTNNRNFEVVETFKVTNNKYLQLVRVGTRYFVISICKDTISFISEMSKEEIDLFEDNKNTYTDKFVEIFCNAKEKLTKRGEK